MTLTSTEPEPLLVATDLAKHYGGRSPWRSGRRLRALDGVSLSVRDGESFGIVGESGSGKSTLARVLAALETPDRGTLRVAGQDVATLSRRELRRWRRNTQLVFQDPYSSLSPRMTIGDIVCEPWVVHPDLVPRAERPAQLAGLLESVGLTSSHARRRPQELSGGQRQRVAIARALALKPRLMICDEPLSSLDVSIQAQVLQVLAEIRESHGVSYVFISHDLSVVRHFCERVAVMYLGRILESGRSEDVYRQPKHPYTKALLSSIVVPRFEQRSDERIVLEGEIPTPTAVPSGCRFRTRCWKAEDVCATTAPPLDEVQTKDHLAACHFPCA